MAKNKKKEVEKFDCRKCVNSIFIQDKNELHCSTKIKSIEGLTDYSKVGIAFDCGWYRAKK